MHTTVICLGSVVIVRYFCESFKERTSITTEISNFKVIYSLCNTEEMQTFISLARRSSGHLFINGECRERAAGLDDMQVYDLL